MILMVPGLVNGRPEPCKNRSAMASFAADDRVHTVLMCIWERLLLIANSSLIDRYAVQEGFLDGGGEAGTTSKQRSVGIAGAFSRAPTSGLHRHAGPRSILHMSGRRTHAILAWLGFRVRRGRNKDTLGYLQS